MTECRTYTVPALTEGEAGTGYYDTYILDIQYFGMYYMPQFYFPVMYCTGVPTERKFVIDAETRTYTIPAESRTYTVPCTT